MHKENDDNFNINLKIALIELFINNFLCMCNSFLHKLYNHNSKTNIIT